MSSHRSLAALATGAALQVTSSKSAHSISSESFQGEENPFSDDDPSAYRWPAANGAPYREITRDVSNAAVLRRPNFGGR